MKKIMLTQEEEILMYMAKQKTRLLGVKAFSEEEISEALKISIEDVGECFKYLKAKGDIKSVIMKGDCKITNKGIIRVHELSR